MDWVIQSKGDRNKWKKEINLVVYGKTSWNGISAFRLHCTLPLSLKKFFVHKSLAIICKLSSCVQKKEFWNVLFDWKYWKEFFMVIFRFILDGTDLYNMTCFTRLFMLWALEELQRRKSLCSRSSWGREEKNQSNHTNDIDPDFL